MVISGDLTAKEQVFMKKAQTIVIIHKKTPPLHDTYLLSYLRKSWEESGFIVKDVYGVDEYIPADVAFMHVDMSLVPNNFQNLASRYNKVINGKVHDIRKTSISKNLVSRGDPYDEQVIVKTNLNSAGFNERGLIHRVYNRYKNFIPDWAQPFFINSQKDYTIFENPSAVPKRVYFDPRYVVEKFLPEKWGKLYCHRRYYFFGEREVNQLWLTKDPLCLSDDEIVLDKPVEPELQSLRHKLGFDYGCFDYVIKEGEIVLFDTNTTPTVGLELDFLSEMWVKELASNLQDGIFSFVNALKPTRK